MWVLIIIALVVVALLVLNFVSQSQDKKVASVAKNIVTWKWTKTVMYSIVFSAGTASELAFLIASLWMSEKANVQQFVLIYLTKSQMDYVTYLAASAYVALPECIVFLATVVTINHFKLWNVSKLSRFWGFAYGIPTLLFLILSYITLSASVGNASFEMPEPLVIIRATAAYTFAFLSFLYVFLGEPSEKERLQEKDNKISDLTRNYEQRLVDLERETGIKIGELTLQTEKLTRDLNDRNRDIEASKKQHSELINALNKSSEDALSAYSEDCKKWLSSGIKSVLPDEIPAYTGHSKRKITLAIKDGKFRFAPNNKNLILVSSLREWLINNPPSEKDTERDTGPILRLVNQ